MIPHTFQHFSLLIFLLILLTGCARPIHGTAEEALQEFPGYLAGDNYAPGTEEILRRIEVDRGVVLIYRWQSQASTNQGTHCVAATQVKKVQGGWKAESSTSPGATCDFNVQTDFVVGQINAGNQKILYGVHPTARDVEVAWTDGEISSGQFEERVFVLMREGVEVGMADIEIFDANGVELSADYQ